MQSGRFWHALVVVEHAVRQVLLGLFISRHALSVTLSINFKGRYSMSDSSLYYGVYCQWLDGS